MAVDSDPKEVIDDSSTGKLSHLKRILSNLADKGWHYYEQVSFITLHYLYFIITCLIASLVFWGSSGPEFKVRYIDSLFLVVSAMTTAGLNTVNLSDLNTWQQVILFLLMIMGSAILMSCVILHIRKAAFKRRLQELSDRRESRLSRRKRLMSASREWMDRVNSRLSPRIPASVEEEEEGKEEEEQAKVNASRNAGIGVRFDVAAHPTRVNSDESATTDSSDSIDNAKAQNSYDGEHLQIPADAATLKSPRSTTTHVTFASDVRFSRTVTNTPTSRLNKLSSRGIGANSKVSHPRNAAPIDDSEHIDVSLVHHQHTVDLHKYLDTFNGYIGRNSQFHQLTQEERHALGGIEYDALSLLTWVVPIYLILFQLLGAVACGAWMHVNRPALALENGQNPFWTGIFFAVSAFNNSGMALLDANASALQTSYYMLLTLSLLSLAGNTCFPIFLRLILWTMKLCMTKWDHWRCILEYILDHPRRVYTHLFPSQATWWLALTLLCIDGSNWLLFMVLNLNNSTLIKIPTKFRVLDGLFQAFAVRGTGFFVTSISALSPGTLMLYAAMMYLSAFPITMSIRSTNVYEERSLGMFADDAPTPASAPSAPGTPVPKLNRAQTALNMVKRIARPIEDGVKSLAGTSIAGGPKPDQNSTWNNKAFLSLQLRSQLGHDLWWLAGAIFLTIVIETSSISRDPINFSIFNFLFEGISAYGPVGLSVGVPWDAYSFSGEWHTLSKLILIAVMLRGRHRGLPVAIDRAILLPDESLDWAEEEDGHVKRSRTAITNSLSARTTPATTPGVTPRVGTIGYLRTPDMTSA